MASLAVSTPIVHTFDPGSFLLLPARRGHIGRAVHALDRVDMPAEERLRIGHLRLLAPRLCQRRVDEGAQRLVVAAVGLVLGVEKARGHLAEVHPGILKLVELKAPFTYSLVQKNWR